MFLILNYNLIPAIKNKLLNLYFKLREFKFEIALFLELKKMKYDD